jgi:hypothetical protein
MVSKVSRASSKSKAALPPPSSGPIILSREEEARLAKEKKDRLDSIKRQYSQNGRRKGGSRDGRALKKGPAGKSPVGGTTRCTRDEDINIEEFMRDDLRQINREEDKL